MGLADIAVQALESEKIRKTIGDAGIRVFNSSFEDPDKDDQGGVLGWLWNGGKRIVGWLLQEAGKILSFSLSALWGWITSTVQFIWNFDWNVTDKTLDQQIKSKFDNLGSLLGGTLGNLVGYLGCGVVPGAVVFSFNEPLGAYILGQVSEELKDEFLANLSSLVRFTFISATQYLIMWSFKNVRKFIKSNVSFFQDLFGEGAGNAIKAWGSEGSKPWSFAIATNKAVESIPNTFVKNFVEEFLEEAWDGCVEAGYVVANSVDSFLAAEKLKKQEVPAVGKMTYVEVKPDRSLDHQRIVLAGPQKLLETQIVSTLTNYQQMQDKDIGTFVGNPTDDYLRVRPQSLRIVIKFFSESSPPWQARTNSRLVTATYAIPEIEPSKIDWERLKQACGGVNGYLWGRYRATIILDNGRQIQCWGASGGEAEDRAKAFLQFTKGKPIRAKATITEDRTEDNTGSFVKQPIRVYPAYFTILNQYQVPGANGSGIPINGKRYIRKRDRIDLWTSTKPDDFNEIVLEMLKKPGAETTT
ncbi:hypothetical protein NIES2101_23970 [Calothrix sp. HK-06]|nr:hypothetical protein NIES2101_23835 [Calothrix sp. HK-06]OKH47325.1 hypothetical protein NIES2101_23970 [Calothrix sp. HK-06]